MSDPCFDSLSHGVEVSQLHLGMKKRKPVEHVEADEVGRAWTVVDPALLKEWTGEKT